MKDRILRSLVFFMITLGALVALAVVIEISHDQSRGATLPQFVQVASYFSPISFGVLLYPLLAAFSFFLNTENQEFKMTTVLWVLAAFLFLLAVVSASITALNHLAYLNGPNPISTGQLIANGFIIGCLLLTIPWALQRKRSPIKAEQVNPITIPKNPKNQPD
ncbi:MAG: hypothetical protein AAGJ81_15715 [Verrucomicrobiota bacterium]